MGQSACECWEKPQSGLPVFFDGPWGHILTMTLYPVGKRAFQAEAATGQRLAGKNAQENAKR